MKKKGKQTHGVDKLLTRTMHRKDIRSALVGIIIMIDNGYYDNESTVELLKDITIEIHDAIGEQHDQIFRRSNGF